MGMVIFELTPHLKPMITRDKRLDGDVRNTKDLNETLHWTRDMISDVV